MEKKGETKGKNITHPRLFKQLNPEKMTSWGGGLPLTGSNTHLYKKEKGTGSGREERKWN